MCISQTLKVAYEGNVYFIKLNFERFREAQNRPGSFMAKLYQNDEMSLKKTPYYIPAENLILITDNYKELSLRGQAYIKKISREKHWLTSKDDLKMILLVMENSVPFTKPPSWQKELCEVMWFLKELFEKSEEERSSICDAIISN